MKAKEQLKRICEAESRVPKVLWVKMDDVSENGRYRLIWSNLRPRQCETSKFKLDGPESNDEIWVITHFHKGYGQDSRYSTAYSSQNAAIEYFMQAEKGPTYAEVLLDRYGLIDEC